jgi:hypothetical protein
LFQAPLIIGGDILVVDFFPDKFQEVFHFPRDDDEDSAFAANRADLARSRVGTTRTQRDEGDAEDSTGKMPSPSHIKKGKLSVSAFS